MRLSKNAKITLGIITGAYMLVPLAYIFAILLLFASMISADVSGADEMMAAFSFFGSLSILVLVCLLNLLHIGLLVFFLTHLVKNQQGLDFVRIVLGVGFFFLPWAAMPAYYLVYILPERVADWAQQRAPGQG